MICFILTYSLAPRVIGLGAIDSLEKKDCSSVAITCLPTWGNEMWHAMCRGE